MSSQLAQLQEATIKQHCKTLRMPMMASQFSTLAEQAVREKGFEQMRKTLGLLASAHDEAQKKG